MGPTRSPAGGPRCWVCCRPWARMIGAAARDRYLKANPTSAYYIDFGDFTFYRLDVQSIRYVGGYGRMSWVDAAAYALAEPDPLATAAAGIIEHMNGDHAEAQVLFCR